MSAVTVSVRVFAQVVEVGRSRGVDMDRVMTKVGVDPSALSDPEGRLPLAQEEALWNATAEACGDPAFGVHAAGHLRTDRFDVLGYALRTSPTLRRAFDAVVRYNRLIHDIAVFAYEEDGDVVRITHRFRGDPRGPSWHASDYTMGTVYLLSQHLIGESFRLRDVWLSHPAPADMAPYREVFGVTPRFDAPYNLLSFAAALLDRPVVTRDDTLHDILLRTAESALERLPDDPSVASRVREVVAPELCAGDPSIDAVAPALAMSARTLQRRLREEGTTWSEVVDGLKRDLALRWLGSPDLSVAEVGYLLGYSEPSPFHRAFRRWTGQTPARWREQHLAGSVPPR